ncbi:group 1 truncated hemoglobin [Sphaerisporangium flaviroseum]|uniref:Group 1 truncated hemoglobin n=1 Tax=Sphaerisporangium flaviroseum TaxID=509199 RepID=A0ABP7JAT1_9ACTN
MAISPSYYDQIAGAQVLPDIVQQFYTIVLDDPDLKPYFDDVDMARLRRHMVILLGAILGGPYVYEGRELGEAHKGLGITDEHYGKVVKILVTLLRRNGVGQEVINHLVVSLTHAQPAIVAGPA